MSSHAKTIQLAEQAVAACEATLRHVQDAADDLDTVGGLLGAAFEGTEHAIALGQHHHAAEAGIGGAGHAVARLMSELAAALARFQN